MIFLIQTVNNDIVHDFAFTLREAVRYHKWYYGNDSPYDFALSETCEIPAAYKLEEIVPVGSVEFVLEFLKKYYGIKNVKPLNIPLQLMTPSYIKRKMYHIKCIEPYVNSTGSVLFIKDNSRIKGYVNYIMPGDSIPPGNYLVSEVVDIESEWRAFVFNRQLVGLNNYLGDFTMFPDVDLINNMISCYTESPKVYTLDVGISRERGTFLIECHNFFSCGLYGFSDLKLLPVMMSMGVKEVIEEYKDKQH